MRIKKTTPRPRSIAWLFALTSGGLTVLAALFILAAGDTARRALAFERLSETLDRHDFFQAQRFLGSLAESSTLDSLLNVLVPGRSEMLPRRRETGRALIDITSLVATNKPDQAAAKFEGEVYHWLSASLKTARDPEVTDLASTLRSQLARTAGNQQEIDGIKAEIVALADQRRALQKRYDLLGQDLGELFSLRPLPREHSDELPPFYTQGILSGLPVMTRLRDGVPDLEGLSRELGLAGGRVTLEGPTAHEEFVVRMEAQRQGAAQIRSEWLANTSRESELSSKATALRSESSAQRTKSLQDLKRALSVLTQPGALY